jgi:signal transduction histidine kinase
MVKAQTFQTLKERVSLEPNVKVKLSILENAQASFNNSTTTEQAHYWHLLALIQQENNQFQTSISSSTHSINLIIKSRNVLPLLLAQNYTLRANSVYKVDSSLLTYCEDIDKAVNLLTDLKSEVSTLASILSQQSLCVFEKTNNIPKALALVEQAISLAQEHLLNNEEQATIYNETALIYRKLSLYDKAYQYNLIAKNKWALAKEYQGVYFMLKNLIITATDLAKYKLAQEHLEELLSFAQKHPEFNDLLFYFNYHSAVLARAQEKWPLAISFFEKTIALKHLSSNIAYTRAAYEQLSLMYYRNNQPAKSFEIIALINSLYPGLPPIKKEVTPIILINQGYEQAALNNVYELLDESESKKRDFIQKSTATLAQVNNDSLKQLDNMLLKQRFNYLAIIALLIVMILTLFSYVQIKRRKILKKEKENASQLLSQKNKLLEDVSHELNTPLTVLKLQVEWLKDDLSEDVHASYDALDNKLNDIQQLINDIQQLAQSDIGVLALNYKKFNVKECFDDWKNEFEHVAEANQLNFTLINNLPDNIFINADRDKIKQVFTNLLANSVKYTDKPGKIIISTHCINHIMNIIMEDSAPSVPNTALTKIFERLYRVEGSRNRETGGSGLGLAICKNLIEEHKGEIYAEQSALKGLRITIRLPIQHS